MKEIPLTQGKVALVDDEDFESIANHKWCAHQRGNTFYAERSRFGNRGGTILMHREILSTSDTALEIDHIDGNGLNNTRANLRVVTHAENMKNQHQPTDDLKPIKITSEANRAIEAYLGWQRGIGVDISKQDALEDAVLFFVTTKMPAPLRKVFNLPTAN
jgi:hypothetical protein